jgi:hypothetical protein
VVLPYSTGFTVSIICYTIDALVLFSQGVTFLQLVPSSTQWTGLFALAILLPMVKPAALEASHGNQVVFDVADLPSYFQFSVLKFPYSLRTDFYDSFCVTPFGCVFERAPYPPKLSPVLGFGLLWFPPSSQQFVLWNVIYYHLRFPVYICMYVIRGMYVCMYCMKVCAMCIYACRYVCVCVCVCVCVYCSLLQLSVSSSCAFFHWLGIVILSSHTSIPAS